MEARIQESVVRSLVKKTFAFCSLLFAFCLGSSSSNALSWSPEDILKAHIKEHYPWPETEINDLTISANLPDEPPLKLTVEKGPPGKTAFAMEFRNGVKITATAQVKALDWIVMSGRAFRKGYRLQNEDVYAKLVDVARIPKGAIKSPDQIIGKALTRSVIANMPLVDDMVSDMQPVKKGRKVVLMVESPSFTITTSGETRENSYVGSYVKTMNLASKKVITGILVDENTVRVEF